MTYSYSQLDFIWHEKCNVLKRNKEHFRQISKTGIWRRDSVVNNSGISTAIWNPGIGSRFICLNKSRSVKKGSVSSYAELSHLSLIVYEVASEKVRGLIPANFELEEKKIDGKPHTWISVVSYLDFGNVNDGNGCFERTDYNLHIIHEGKPALYLLRSSLGSLSAVATRNLWPMPWNLGAMEFQISYDKSVGRYKTWRLQTQSESATASWEIEDSGSRLDMRDLRSSLPASLLTASSESVFIRKDGNVGSYSTKYSGVSFTGGTIRTAQSDVLVSSGLLSKEELQRPAFVGLQNKVRCQIYTPVMLGSEGSKGNQPEPVWSGLAYAS